MPDTKDLAALPTSWALTIWDAVPVFLSVELAIAVLLVAILQRPAMARAWRLSSAYPVGGIVYLGLFDQQLAVILGLAIVSSLVAQQRFPLDSTGSASPGSPFEAIKNRGGAIIWDVAKASAVAAIIKIILAPELGQQSLAWVVLSLFGGLVFPGPLGVAAIPALSVSTASDGLLAPLLWILMASCRPWIAAAVIAWRSPATSTG